MGKRDSRLVTVRRGGTLDDGTHRMLALWAADCAARVLPIFEREFPGDFRPRRAIEVAREWAGGKTSMMLAREAAFAAHAAARSSTGAASEAARAAGHAVATAHMADHELGAAAYAIRAVRAEAVDGSRDDAGKKERNWQIAQLPSELLELVLDDQRIRNRKFWSLFAC